MSLCPLRLPLILLAIRSLWGDSSAAPVAKIKDMKAISYASAVFPYSQLEVWTNYPNARQIDLLLSLGSS